MEIQLQLLCALDPDVDKGMLPILDMAAASQARTLGYHIDGDPQEVTDEEDKTVRFWMLKAT